MSEEEALKKAPRFADPASAFRYLAKKALEQAGHSLADMTIPTNQDAIVVPFFASDGSVCCVTASGLELRLNNTPELLPNLVLARVKVALKCAEMRGDAA